MKKTVLLAIMHDKFRLLFAKLKTVIGTVSAHPGIGSPLGVLFLTLTLLSQQMEWGERMGLGCCMSAAHYAPRPGLKFYRSLLFDVLMVHLMQDFTFQKSLGCQIKPGADKNHFCYF